MGLLGEKDVPEDVFEAAMSLIFEGIEKEIREWGTYARALLIGLKNGPITSDRIAIITDEEEMTYKQLHEYVNKVAAYFIYDLHVQKEKG